MSTASADSHLSDQETSDPVENEKNARIIDGISVAVSPAPVPARTPPTTRPRFARRVSASSSSSSVGGENSSPLQAQSLSAMAMDEVTSLLREQDADLLEQHESNAPNDSTPQLHTTRFIPDPTLPPDLMLPLAATPESNGKQSVASAKSHAVFAAGVPVSSNSSITPGTVKAMSSLIKRQAFIPSSPADNAFHFHDQSSHIHSTTSTEINSIDHTALDSTSDHSLQPGDEEAASERRPTLGGQVFCQQQNGVIAEEYRRIGPHPPQSSFGPETLMPGSSSPPTASAAVVNMQSMIMSQSDRIDRRISEAAQFAHAIGDVKVAQALEILEEDNDDDDDDDDDDDARHHVEDDHELLNNSAATCSLDGFPRIHRGASVDAETDLSFVGLDAEKCHVSKGHDNDNVLVTNEPHSTQPSRFLQGNHTKRGFLDQLPHGYTSGQSDYVYKGLHANPPEVVKRGIQRGNYAQLHRKAWLEVSDKYHRYGKNLRFYYRHWESLGCPTNMFFDWLDSKGEAAGQPLPEIQECPRAQLDSDTVLYITDPEVTENYALTLLPDDQGRGRVVDIDRQPVKTGPDGWIFVLRDNRLYGAQKITSVTGHRSKERFHHSSFFGGKAVAAAGIFITDDQGFLTRLYPHSGHYRPREAHMQRVLFFLHHEGVDLRTFDMDMQQILHVARDKDIPKTGHDTLGKHHSNNNNTHDGDPVGSNNTVNNSHSNNKSEKKKKVESLYLTPAVLVACFLAHKARLIGAGFFEQIHQIRKSNVTTVREALDLIGDGGYWFS